MTTSGFQAKPTTTPPLAAAALAAAKAAALDIDRVTGGKVPSWYESKVAAAHLLGLADARPGDAAVVTALGLLSVISGQAWSEEACAAKATARTAAATAT